MFRWMQRPSPEATLDKINRQFLGMLDDGRHIFDAAANCVLGKTDPEVIREDLFSTDRRINGTEQLIRREIVVHGSVHGSTSFPSLLVMMSLVKDAERIGDYGKNIFDLAVKGSGVHDAQEHKKLVEMKDRLSKLLVRARALCESQEVEGARRFTWDSDSLTDECDAAVDRLLAVQGVNAATAVLLFRYFKRVAGHLSNIVSSVFMPIDKLDFFDEPRES
jgi:phosphate uptake regulator